MKNQRSAVKSTTPFLQKETRKKRVLFIAEAVTLSHVARPFVLAQSLNPDEYDVYFACDPRGRWVWGPSSLRHRTIHSIPPSELKNRLAASKPIYNVTTLLNYIDEDLSLIKDIQPDVIVGDFRLSLSVSARMKKIPYINIVNLHWSPYARIQPPYPKKTISSTTPSLWAAARFYAHLISQSLSHSRPLNQVRKKFGLMPLPHDVRSTYTDADQILYPDIPGLVQIKKCPPHHHIIGPVLWEPSSILPSWWDQIPQDKPIVYVTLGSSGPSTLLPFVLHSLADLPVTVLAATAGQAQPTSHPNNVFLSDYLPGSTCAKKAAVAITNGGAGSTPQMLSQGVPVLGLPGLFDQEMAMAGVEAAGAGIRLTSEFATKGLIKEAVEQLLHNPEYRLSAKNWSLEMTRLNAPRSFQTILKKVVQETSSRIFIGARP